MARWLITDGDRQFSVRDMTELKELAAKGRIGESSMIQPPGASDWLYATEVPELEGLLRSSPGNAAGYDEFDDIAAQRARSRQRNLLVVLALVAAVGGVLFWRFASDIPDMRELNLLGGPYGLELTEMLVTEPDTPLLSDPDPEARVQARLAKDSQLQLEAKQRDFYHVQTEDGARGWVAEDHVIPAYYFADARERENYDPVYNPENYLMVTNSRWMQLPDSEAENITVFEFLLNNKSKFEMTNLKLLATIKDRRGNVLEEKEITLEGTVPPYESTVVGTVAPPDDQPDGRKRLMTYHTFSEMAEDNDEYWLRWSDGVEVPMTSQDYTEANIDLLQAHAIPFEKSRRR